MQIHWELEENAYSCVIGWSRLGKMLSVLWQKGCSRCLEHFLLFIRFPAAENYLKHNTGSHWWSILPLQFLQTQFFPGICISVADIKHHPKPILPALVSNTNMISVKQTKTYASANIANGCYHNSLCVGTVITGRSKKCCRLASSVSNLLPCSLPAPCADSLSASVCLCLFQGAWCCWGSEGQPLAMPGVMLEAELLYSLQVWSLGEPWGSLMW